MATPTKFSFETPRGYRWLVDRGHIGFEAGTPLQPWYCLDTPIDIEKHWPGGPSKTTLIGFARRQDNDDIACFEVKNGAVGRIALVHG